MTADERAKAVLDPFRFPGGWVYSGAMVDAVAGVIREAEREKALAEREACARAVASLDVDEVWVGGPDGSYCEPESGHAFQARAVAAIRARPAP